MGEAVTGRGMAFDQKYVIDPDSGCWVWQGYRDRNGYGRHRVEWAHRWSYEHHVGPIPPEHEIDHLCSNPPCVNPDHLEPVTRVEHVRRTFSRLGKDDRHLQAAILRVRGLSYVEIAQALGYAGRTAAATAVNAAIAKGLVDPDDVPRRSTLDGADRADIRAIHAMGVPQTVIGRWYGVDSSQISRICTDARRSA